MGKRLANIDPVLWKHGPLYNEGIRPLYKERNDLAMLTGIERIAEKSRNDKKLQFTSLAHHLTPALLEKSLMQIANSSTPGIDGEEVKAAKASFNTWAEEMIQSVHRQSYRPPPAKRVYIDKIGKKEKRPIAMPTVKDKALQRAIMSLLNAIYEQDFLDCSFGGRENRGAHNALVTLRTAIQCKKVNWVYEADLKNFFGSLDHDDVKRFLLHRVGDPRIIALLMRWMKVGVMENETRRASTQGVPQGGPISVLISNMYLHYVLDLWIEKVVKPRMQGEVYYVRYLDDFILCFQYHEDAKRFQSVIENRLKKFSLFLEPSKTQLVRFGRFAQKNKEIDGGKPETLYFLGFTLYCGVNRNGKFKLGWKTEKTRLRRSFTHITNLLKRIRHHSLRDQQQAINRVLRGHYQYYGVYDNGKSIKRFHYHTVRSWRKWLSTRSQKGKLNWEKFNKIQKHYPLVMPRIARSYDDMKRLDYL